MSNWEELEKFDKLYQNSTISASEYQSKVEAILGKDTTKELENLRIMRQSGILSDIDFEIQKKQLIKNSDIFLEESNTAEIQTQGLLSFLPAFSFSFSAKVFISTLLFMILNAISASVLLPFFKTENSAVMAGIFLILIGCNFFIISGFQTYFMMSAKREIFKTQKTYSKSFFCVKTAQVFLISFVVSCFLLLLVVGGGNAILGGLGNLNFSPVKFIAIFLVLSLIILLVGYYIKSVIFTSYIVHLNFRSVFNFFVQAWKKPLSILNIIVYSIGYMLSFYFLVFIIKYIFQNWFSLKDIMFGILFNPGLSFFLYFLLMTSIFIFVLSRIGKIVFLCTFVMSVILIWGAKLLLTNLFFNIPVPFLPFFVLGQIVFYVFYINTFLVMSYYALWSHLCVQNAYRISKQKY